MYRYAVVIFGASYAQGQVTEPTHCIMVESLDAARAALWNAAHRAEPMALTGEGKRADATPAYGDPGDGAWLYPVPVNDPDYAEVIPTDDGAGARHAWSWLTDLGEHTPDPSHRATFGPRGGVVIEKAY